MKNIKIILTFFICINLIFTSLSNAETTQTWKLAVTDISGLEELQREFKAFQEELIKQSGLAIELYPVSSRTAVVEALKFKKVDFVLTGPAEYVVIAKKTQALPLVGFTRPDYYSAIIVKANSPFKTIADLKGKKVALGDIGSTSYYLAPLQIIKDGGLDPLKDIKQHVVSKQIAWAALKRGDVDALGFSYDRFVQYLNEDQIPISEYRVLAKSAELPNDLLIGGAHVPEAVRNSIKNAFVKGSDLLLAQLLKGERNNKYENMHFLPNVSDENYNLVRKMYITAGYPEFG